MVDETQRSKNRNKSRIRARVEHVFGVVKRLWGFGKVRYRGLQKNATRAFTALALARSFKVLEVRWPRWVEALPAYVVGSLGAYWTIQRTVIFLGGLR